MDLQECIVKRRSTRNFSKGKVINKDTIETIIQAGMNAPSAKNRQPWKFLVLSDKSKLIKILYKKYDEIKETKDPGSLYTTTKCIENCSHIILVFNNQLSTYYHDREFRRHRWLADVQSIGACIENMLLTCEALGIGALWVCDVFYADREIVTEYNRTDELIAAIAIGEKASTKYSKKYLVEFGQAVEWL